MKTLSLLSFFFLLAGCAAENDSESAVTAEDLTAANPSGAFVASVAATGSGCLPGSYDAKISDDGKQVVVTFASYEASLSPGHAFSVKDCNIGLDIHAPRGTSYAVRSFHLAGEATLDKPGMSGTVTAKSTFQGSAHGVEARLQVAGPYDDGLAFDKRLDDSELTWSSCNLVRRLNTQTRLFLQNDSHKTGTGDASIAGGRLEMHYDLEWRTC